ncbi:MAG: hypothetical protein NTZ05_09910, partial [Chloroflexi bacterium]|nr:hypothetical protein [Chloroflexota bacterium]
MGLTVVLQNETNEGLKSICDTENVLHRVLPSHDDESYQCLRSVDWYGDTVFNYLQMDPLLKELKRVSAAVTSNKDKRLLTEIADLAQKCRSERHLYL